MKRVFNLLSDLIFPMANRCPICSKECSAGVCGDCAAELETLRISDEASVFTYSKRVRNIIRRYKFNGEKYLCDVICDYMLPLVKETDVITNVPVHISRRRERGYDQAMLIACGLAKRSGVKYETLLEKTMRTPPQSKLTAEQRVKNVLGKYAVKADVEGRRILLVDDVITTGATINECRRMLLNAGAARVDYISFAKT